MFKALGYKVTVSYGLASTLAIQLGDGVIHAFAFAAGVPVNAFVDIEAKQPVRFLTFAADEIAALKTALPDSLIPKGAYRSLTEDQRTVGIYNFFVGHKDLPDDVAYRITRTVLENNPTMVHGHPAAKETRAENWNRNNFLPFHPGAVRYHREKGIEIPNTLM